MVGYTFPIFINCLCSFYYSKMFEYGLYWDKKLVFWCSLLMVLAFFYFTYIVIRIMIQGKLKGDVFEDGTNFRVGSSVSDRLRGGVKTTKGATNENKA